MQTKNLTNLVRFSADGPHREEVFATERLRSEIVSLERGQETARLREGDADALYTVVSGQVVIYLDRKFKRFKQWGAVVAPAGTDVLIRNASTDPAVVLVVTAPGRASDVR